MRVQSSLIGQHRISEVLSCLQMNGLETQTYFSCDPTSGSMLSSDIEGKQSQVNMRLLSQVADLCSICGADAAVHLNPGVDAQLIAQLPQACNLAELGLDKALTAKARVDCSQQQHNCLSEDGPMPNHLHWLAVVSQVVPYLFCTPVR